MVPDLGKRMLDRVISRSVTEYDELMWSLPFWLKMGAARPSRLGTERNILNSLSENTQFLPAANPELLQTHIILPLSD